MNLSKRILWSMTLAGLAGVLAHAIWPDAATVRWLVDYVAQPVGQVFLRLLLMVVVPLVFSTLVLGVVELGDLSRLGRIGIRTIVLFFLTTTFAALFGLVVVNLVRPGVGITPELQAGLAEAFAPQASASVAAAGDGVTIETFVNIVPRNPLAAAARGDLLAVIFFTLIFAVALTQVPKPIAEPVVRVLEGIARTMMIMIDFAMKLAPVGVAGLTFAATAAFGLDILRPLGLYTGAVLAGLALYQFGLLPMLVAGLGRLSIRRFLRDTRLPMVTAFSTASSSATLPTTLRAAEDRLGIPRRVAGFVLPLGATLHMNGTAFFAAITVVFLGQAFGVAIPLASQLLVAVMVVLTSVAAAGVPSGSIPLIIVILASVNVPGEAIALMLGVEPLLGMARTSTNVTGDLVASVVVARGEGWAPSEAASARPG